MTYRTQDPAALQARIGELEAENKRLRRGDRTMMERFIAYLPRALYILFCIAVGGAIGAVGGSAIVSCSADDAECDYQCATHGGFCEDEAPSGFTCYRAEAEGRSVQERFAVPRSERR